MRLHGVGRVFWSLLPVGWVMGCLFGQWLRAAETAHARDHRFDGKIPRPVLENCLSRSITMEGLLNGRGDLDDNIRMLESIGAKFIGRSLCLWGSEANLLHNLERARQQVPRIHAADPAMILQERRRRDHGTLA